MHPPRFPRNHSGRRAFLRAAAVAPLGALRATQADAAAQRIDCQSHVFPPELLALLERRRESPYAYREAGQRYVVIGSWRRKVLPKHTDLDAKLADMDRCGIARAALSINDPGPELFGRDGPAVARLANDFLAEAARRHPARFFALAVLPLEDIDEAMRELDRAAGRLGARGILLYSNLNGKFPDLPEFRPLFRRAEELDLPVLLHPAYPVTYEATRGYEMAAGLGLMFDTTIALCRIVLSGLLDEHPRLRLVCPHVGGALPYLIGRIDHQTQVLGRGAEKLKELPSRILRRVYLDTVTPLPLALRYAYDFAGPDRLVFGSDHPWVDPALIVEAIRSLRLPPADEAKIFGGNAARLFRL